MNKTKHFNNPNRLALKQRYAYSRMGSPSRAVSADLIRPGSVVANRADNATPNGVGEGLSQEPNIAGGH